MTVSRYKPQNENNNTYPVTTEFFKAISIVDFRTDISMFYCLKNKMLCAEDYLKHIARGRTRHSFQWQNSIQKLFFTAD